jgi:hypothetical protein
MINIVLASLGKASLLSIEDWLKEHFIFRPITIKQLLILHYSYLPHLVCPHFVYCC